MDLSLERSELAILVLHLNIMRKAIKKGFKANYGHFEGRNKLKLYDSLKERFESQLNEETDPIYFDLNAQEVDMLHSFMYWYVSKIKSSAKEQGANAAQDEQIAILEAINIKAHILVESAAI